MHNSLRRQLLAWVTVPLMAAIAVDAWVSYSSARDTASVVQDQLLLGSARMIAQQISFADGSFQHEIPPAALELFQSAQPDRVFYRVTTGGGVLLSGYTDLGLPTAELSSDAPHFYASSMRGQPVRVVAFFQPVMGSPSARPAIVQVAQTTHTHQQLTTKLWLQAMGQQLVILALCSVFILFGLHRGLRPLLRLRDDVRARKEGSLQRLETDSIPGELKPLVDAFNDYLQRLEHYTHVRGTFLQNAAHQLRTPLAVLNVQISDAMRAPDKATADAAMLAARRTLQQTTRLVNQFLTLSSAESHTLDRSPLSTQACCDILQKVLEDLAAQAHRKEIDLGFERSGAQGFISGHPTALREIATNLIDNAIRYTPAHGVVTVRLHTAPDCITLGVEDNGPGVAPEHRDKIFQRFYRVEGTATEGTGLGLAIVKELALQCGGQLQVRAPAQGGTGLVVEVAFPCVTAVSAERLE